MLSKIFSAFANTVLERTLPSVREWLRERFGEEVALRSMEMDGPRIHLLDARLPVGPTAFLEVERATFLTYATELVAGRPPLRLESMVGALVVPSESREDPEPRFIAPLTLSAEPPVTGLEWVYGRVSVRGARWRASMGHDEPAPLDGEVMVSVTVSDWSLEDGKARAADAEIEIEARGRLDGDVTSARLTARDARTGHFLDAIAALAGRTIRIPVPLPWLGRIGGTLALENTNEVRADLTLRTESSRLRLESTGDRGGVIEEGRLSGELDLADLLPEAFAPYARLDASAPLVVDGQIRGPFDALEGRLDLAVERVSLTHLRTPLAAEGHLTLVPEAPMQLALDLAGEGVSLRANATRLAEGPLRGTLEGELSPAAFRVDPFELGGATVRLRGGFEWKSKTARSMDLVFTADELRVARSGRALPLTQANVRVTEEAVSARARIAEGHLDAELCAGAPGRLSLTEIDAPSVASLAALANLGEYLSAVTDDEVSTFELPETAALDAELSLTREELRGQISARTASSSLRLAPFRLTLPELGFDGTVLSGTLEANDAVVIGLFPGPLRPTSGTASAEMTLRGAGVEAVLEGRLDTSRLEWALAAWPDAPPAPLTRASTNLRIDGEAVTLDGLTGVLFGGRFELDLRVRYEDAATTMRLRCDDAHEELTPWLEALVGSRLPGRLRLDAMLETDEARVVRGPIRIHKPKSSIEIELALSPELWVDGTKVVGELTMADLYDLTAERGLTVAGKGTLRIDATLEGSTDHLEALVSLHTGACRVMLVGAGVPGVKLDLDGGSARLHVSRARVLLSELSLRGYNGRLSAKGLYAFEGSGDTRFSGAQAKLEVADLRLDEVPLPGGGRIGESLKGRLSSKLSLTQRDGKFRAKGDLRVDEPRYVAVRRTRSALSRFGLRPPDEAGVTSLSAEVSANDEAWRLSGLTFALRGLRVDGDVSLRRDGRLGGAVDVLAKASYLRTSTLLSIPASLVGDVSFPVALRGTTDAPDFDADGFVALDRLIAKVDVGRGLQRAVDGLMDDVFGSGQAPRRPARATPERRRTGLSDDAIIDRIAEGVGLETEDRLLGVLIDRGLSPDDIATRLEEARERRGR